MKELGVNKYTILDNFSVDVYGSVRASYEMICEVNFRKVYGDYHILHDKYNKTDEILNHPNSPEYIEGVVSIVGFTKTSKDYNKIRKAHKRSSVINNILKKSNV